MINEGRRRLFIYKRTCLEAVTPLYLCNHALIGSRRNVVNVALKVWRVCGGGGWELQDAALPDVKRRSEASPAIRLKA
jgi:hypothetical protein